MSSRGTGTASGAVARSGALALVGAVVSALMGFAFTVTLGRTLGPAGAGVVLQAVAAFTIALAVGRFGLDTTAVWLLPRLADEDPARLRAGLTGLLVPALGLGTVAGLGLAAVAAAYPPEQRELTLALWGMAGFLPLAAAMTVGLSATRGLGGVRPFVLINSIAIPTARPALVLAITAVGLGSVAVAVSWAAPTAVAVVVTVWLLWRRVRRAERRSGAPPGGVRPDQALVRRIRRYALPRSVSTVLEQALHWLDVVLVGVLAGQAAAGVYGTASRLVAAGLVLSTALRIVVAPLYSRSLGRGDVPAAQSLYTTTTSWIVLGSLPVPILFALFGSTWLGLFGPGFREGSVALALLCIGLAGVLLAGNIQSMLLMSGRSGRAAVNKGVALLVTVALIALLVPRLGIEGAALAWTTGALVDTGLAAWQVHRLVGVRVAGRGVWTALLVAVVGFGLPALVSRLLLGDTGLALLVGAVGGGAVWAGASALFRERLHLDDVLAMLQRRRSEGEDS